MKKSFLILAVVAMCTITPSQAQELIPPAQITVSGEGKVKVEPDQAFISISVENKGSDATSVKKENDKTVAEVIKAIKDLKLPKEDVQTKRVSLSSPYDYDKKKYNYVATQTIEILLRDLSKYDMVMEKLINAGVNTIGTVDFRSSKLAEYQSQARKLAMKEAQLKANDYVSVLGQKVGPAIMINDNSQPNYPRPMMYSSMAKGAASSDMPRETIAIGEIDVTANVTVSFKLN